MAELGSNSGTGYPSALDTDGTVEVDSPNAGKTLARAAVVNDLAAAVIAIQTILGTNPQSSAASVKAFLTAQHTAAGGHGNLTATQLIMSGNLAPHQGADIASTATLAVGIPGTYHDVTGANNITKLAAVGVGNLKILQFDGICTIEDDGDFLKIGGTNIVTSAGFVIGLYEYAVGKWRKAFQSSSGIPSGAIMIWSGAISAIPGGWVICDGTNSTPNLEGRFVIHASADSGDTYDVGDTGGSTSTGGHVLTIAETPAHDHTYSGQASRTIENGSGTSASYASGSPSSSSTGGGGSHSHADSLPPYYALAYIMKT